MEGSDDAPLLPGVGVLSEGSGGASLLPGGVLPVVPGRPGTGASGLQPGGSVSLYYKKQERK